MILNGKKEDFEDLIKEMDDFISDRKQMILSCKNRIRQAQSGLFSQLGKEYSDKRIHEENELINRLTQQIMTNQTILNELKESFNKQFN